MSGFPSNDSKIDLSPIIRLPTELHSLIAYHLEELSARIIFRRLTSKALFPESNHQSLLLPPWRYSMAEARQASEDLRKRGMLPQTSYSPQDTESDRTRFNDQAKTSNSVFWENSKSSVTPRPPRPLRSLIKPPGMEGSPEEEAVFFSKSLSYLTGEHLGSRAIGRNQDEVGLKVLSLVTWFGIDASIILGMLLTSPILKDVQTLVKTERLDSEVWRPSNSSSLFAPPQGQSRRREVVRTQATFRVGSRVEGKQGCSEFLKGFGLRIGYECWCFVKLSPIGNEFEDGSSDNTSRQRSAGDEVDPDLGDCLEAEGAEEEDPLFNLNPNFHIIIQGRYEKQDAMMLENTLDKSFIICNRCKNEILF